MLIFAAVITLLLSFSFVLSVLVGRACGLSDKGIEE